MLTQPLVHSGQNLRVELRVRHPSLQLNRESRRDTIDFALDLASAAIDSKVLQREQDEGENLG